MYQRILFICLLLTVTAQTAYAQQARYKAWIEVESEKEQKKIIAKFVNNTLTAQQFRFTLHLNKKGSNSASNTQSGTVTALPAQTQHLSDAQVNITSQDYFKALLLVYLDGQIVAQDSFVTGTKPIVTTKPQSDLNNSGDELEIDGLIIDETRSKTARDFYDFFYSKWIAPPGAKDYSIKIRELPSRGRVARITVEVNDRALYTRVLQPRLEVVENMALQAINIIRNHLQQNESLKKDLENEDQQGSGIF